MSEVAAAATNNVPTILLIMIPPVVQPLSPCGSDMHPVGLHQESRSTNISPRRSDMEWLFFYARLIPNTLRHRAAEQVKHGERTSAGTQPTLSQ
jgi:hypothetical protein